MQGHNIASLQYRFADVDFQLPGPATCEADLPSYAAWQARNMDVSAMETIFVAHTTAMIVMGWPVAQHVR
jgi:hypothetical protein